MNKPYLLFDAGGTIVFPNYPYLAFQLSKASGFDYSAEIVEERHWQLVYEMDKATKESNQLMNHWAQGYSRNLYESFGIDGLDLDQIIHETEAFDRDHNLWCYSYEWIGETLKGLKEQGFKMSVISNADGRVQQLLIDLGLRDYFEEVFDSAILGVEKPNPMIFEIAMTNLGLKPDEALYIGDIYYIDVWGANQAGLGCVHLDWLQNYQGWSGVHLTDIRQLNLWLKNNFHAGRQKLHPMLGVPLVY